MQEYSPTTVAEAKAKYSYPWWASENPIEVFWGQINEVEPCFAIRLLETIFTFILFALMVVNVNHRWNLQRQMA